MKRLLFASPIPMAGNPTIRAILQGMQAGLTAHGIALEILNDEVVTAGAHDYPAKPIRDALDRGADAIGYYVIDPALGGEAAARALAAGVPIVSIARPTFTVSASLSYPGFNQGVFMMQHLLDRLPAGATLGIIGGPNALTDSEEIAGLVHTARRSTAILVNDPENPLYSNVTDDRAGGRIAAERFFAEFGAVDALVPYNDETMLGVLDLLEERPDIAPPKMVSRNGSPLAVDAVRKKRTCGTWDIEPVGVGLAFARLAVDLLVDGAGYVDQAFMAPAGRMIIADNVDSWQSWDRRADLRPLNIVG